ncbi:MAG TPA: beta-ketoacyl-[acyl-carrier-protein] synthase family protein [Kofleriaceae bacterium]|jgi:3-oxoacyl-[acyl-carrier-protein] synthase II|nr:beta-ketoacyl-[acyl-carrier-protein] synthase family protein [Kofleriaceae bacterium]
MGVITALGRGLDALWSRLAEGGSGIRRIERFDTTGLVPLAGLVEDRNAPAHEPEPWRLCVELAIESGREALARAELSGVPRDRIALVLGTSLGDMAVPLYRMTELVGDALAIDGPRLTVSTACTSSTNAIGLALDLLELGVADAVVAGGSDVLTPLVVAGFHSLGVLSETPCAPFSEPAGTTLGEGAGFLVLQRSRGDGDANQLAVLGYGLAAEAFHDTGPDPTGAGTARAIQAALGDAGVSADEIDYVNAHGTGTRANDPAEWRALKTVFGSRAQTLPVSSSKSFLGHAQGAAGIVEAITTLVAMQHGVIPPTHNFTVARPNAPADPVGERVPRERATNLAVCANAAFGGACCAVVVGKPAGRIHREPARRAVFVAGIGVIAGAGGGRVPGFAIEAIVPSADPRGIDPLSSFVTAAAARALGDAGVAVRGALRERTGLVVGVNHVSSQSQTALRATIDAHGYRGMSASLFSRMVLNAPAGTCSKLLALKGAFSTLSAGAAAGIVAIIYAAELLAKRAELDQLLAGGGDEARPDCETEGAAMILLARSGSIRLAGWALAGPGRLATAIARATRDRPADLTIDPAIDPTIDPRGAPIAFTSALAVATAVDAIRRGAARRVLVTTAGESSVDAALVLEATDAT